MYIFSIWHTHLLCLLDKNVENFKNFTDQIWSYYPQYFENRVCLAPFDISMVTNYDVKAT